MAGPRDVLATIVMEFSPIFVDKMVFASTAISSFFNQNVHGNFTSTSRKNAFFCTQ